jgi:hypothetical protein
MRRRPPGHVANFAEDRLCQLKGMCETGPACWPSPFVVSKPELSRADAYGPPPGPFPSSGAN